MYKRQSFLHWKNRDDKYANIVNSRKTLLCVILDLKIWHFSLFVSQSFYFVGNASPINSIVFQQH